MPQNQKPGSAWTGNLGRTDSIADGYLHGTVFSRSAAKVQNASARE